MKRILFMMLAAVAVLSLTSCKETLPKRFDSFVDKVEKNADSFTEADWNDANAKFEKLVDEFQQNKDSYTSEEKKQVNAAIGKYLGLVTKSGINTAIDAVNGFINQIPSLFEGIGGFLKGLGLEGDTED